MVGHPQGYLPFLKSSRPLPISSSEPPCPAQLHPKQEKCSSPRASGTADFPGASHMPTDPLWRTAVVSIPVHMTCSRVKRLFLSRIITRQGLVATGCGVTRAVFLTFKMQCPEEEPL